MLGDNRVNKLTDAQIVFQSLLRHLTTEAPLLPLELVHLRVCLNPLLLLTPLTYPVEGLRVPQCAFFCFLALGTERERESSFVELSPYVGPQLMSVGPLRVSVLGDWP